MSKDQEFENYINLMKRKREEEIEREVKVQKFKAEYSVIHLCRYRSKARPNKQCDGSQVIKDGNPNRLYCHFHHALVRRLERKELLDEPETVKRAAEEFEEKFFGDSQMDQEEVYDERREDQAQEEDQVQEEDFEEALERKMQARAEALAPKSKKERKAKNRERRERLFGQKSSPKKRPYNPKPIWSKKKYEKYVEQNDDSERSSESEEINIMDEDKPEERSKLVDVPLVPTTDPLDTILQDLSIEEAQQQ